ncbi:MAG TPA: biotin/lipoyl-containing protein [Candidatus Limnocylindria bacterium]|jgi:acetyl-CoA carboxylase biotin carboxyl carrier protein|nr:biotin/lipoyl-containing protein [Candidatus Limnocylindria bacterium]
MTDGDDPLQQIERAAAELIPQLTERLAQHGLGEIEVRHGELRVRVARAVDSAPATAPTRVAATPSQSAAPSERVGVVPSGPSAQGVTSPAVGFFVYADGLGPGLPVDKGDELGHVEMLGVRHDVRAPRRGLVRNLVTETGEAVEYGQLLIEMEAAE